MASVKPAVAVENGLVPAGTAATCARSGVAARGGLRDEEERQRSAAGDGRLGNRGRIDLLPREDEGGRLGSVSGRAAAWPIVTRLLTRNDGGGSAGTSSGKPLHAEPAARRVLDGDLDRVAAGREPRLAQHEHAARSGLFRLLERPRRRETPAELAHDAPGPVAHEDEDREVLLVLPLLREPVERRRVARHLDRDRNRALVRLVGHLDHRRAERELVGPRRQLDRREDRRLVVEERRRQRRAHREVALAGLHVDARSASPSPRCGGSGRPTARSPARTRRGSTRRGPRRPRRARFAIAFVSDTRKPPVSRARWPRPLVGSRRRTSSLRSRAAVIGRPELVPARPPVFGRFSGLGRFVDCGVCLPPCISPWCVSSTMPASSRRVSSAPLTVRRPPASAA